MFVTCSLLARIEIHLFVNVVLLWTKLFFFENSNFKENTYLKMFYEI